MLAAPFNEVENGAEKRAADHNAEHETLKVVRDEQADGLLVEAVLHTSQAA